MFIVILIVDIHAVGFHGMSLSQIKKELVIQDNHAVGRIYEDRQTLPDLRWFWSITVYVDSKRVINTSGRAASLDEVKAQFLSNWQRCRADSTPSGQRST